MQHRHLSAFTVSALLGIVLAGRLLAAQTEDSSIDLIVQAGRPVRVVLTDSSTVKHVGQTLTAMVTEPVYAYDRVVIPAGVRVTGRVTALQNVSRFSRLRSMLSGDFSPNQRVQLQIDALERDGTTTPMRAIAKNGTPRVVRQVARATEPAEESSGVAMRAKDEVKTRAAEAVAGVKQKAADMVAALTQPGRGTRLKEWAVDRLPYHPQVLRKGTVYDAELQEPLSFGRVAVHPVAPTGTIPAPSSILTARLVTTLDSATALRGTPLDAVVVRPVFADDGRLIFPEGTKLTGEVTFARAARRFHRNGQLRFLFERVQMGQEDDAPLLAALHAIDVSVDARVVLDDEGGAAVQDSKTRFVTPALALLALRASVRQGEGSGFETGAANVEARTTSASVRPGGLVGRGVGGFIGFGLLGAALGQVSRPVGVGFAVYGFARSVYANILGKGQEVHFQADTPIQVQMAPGREARP